MDDVIALTQRYAGVLLDVAAKHHRALAARGYTMGPVESDWGQSGGPNGNGTSEIRMQIWRNGRVVDVLEQFVCRDHTPVITIDELCAWADQELRKLAAL